MVYELSILETMYFFGIMFRMRFKEIKQRAHFLSGLLELPPLSKRIKDMRYCNVQYCNVQYICCGNIVTALVEENNGEYHLLCH